MKHVKLYEAFIEEAKAAGGVPGIYIRYRRALEKAKHLEDNQKKLAEPYFAAKKDGDEKAAAKHLKNLKKNQEELSNIRGVISYLETNYINNMDFFAGDSKMAKKLDKYADASWNLDGGLDGTEWY